MRWAVVALAAGGCVRPLDRCEDAAAGDSVSCPTPGWTDRAFDLRVPDAWDGSSPLRVVFAFHGGGGRRRAAQSVTCPGGDVDDAGCLGAVALARGYAVVFPDGTGTRPLRNIRTWNGGGGVDNWQCTSGGACKSGVDDVAYFDDLLAEVSGVLPIDGVYATGLSNGGAITHRLACERGDVLAAIAPVGSGNQFAAAGGACDVQVPMLAIHGTEDPCWLYETGSAACAQDDGKDKIGGRESTDAWAVRDGCDATFTEEALPDVDPDDGTTITHVRWDGCAADVELVRVDGGGHTWPGGDPYLSTDTVGRVSHDANGSELILEFFDAH